MVHIDDKKFACESCIKGHRTSSCNHTERPLFEIKRKGRPVSQCEKCRELRKTRRVHSKCLCSEVRAEDRNRQDSASGSSSGPKPRRFVPIAPALPSGTKDVSMVLKDNHVPDPRYQVDRLLNPCQCKSIWECQCKRTSGASDQARLETLVQVATSISSNALSLPSHPPGAFPNPEPPAVRKSCCASKSAPRVVKDREDTGPVRGPDLPPLLLDPERMVPPPHGAPRFITPTSIPSIKSVVLLAGTGCSCGFECACPGCIEHRVPTSTQDSNLKPCSDGCAHCVDRLGGIALPEPEPVSQRPSFKGVIETFLSRAASLPAPPKNRPADIDPTNITVFPAGLFSVDFGGASDPFGGDVGRKEKARSAWGLVDVPKLECCGGACGCPDGGCRCGTSCAGCCVEGDAPSDPSGPSVLAEPMSCTDI